MKLIPLTQGQFTKVSDHRFEELSKFKWYAVYASDIDNYYAVMHPKRGVAVCMHRFIMQTPKGLMCDHINHETLDNQDENLRNCTPSENQMNRRIQKNNSSGYKGVSFCHQKWSARLQVGGVKVLEKEFDSPEEAARAYDEAAKKYHGEFAVLNFPVLAETAPATEAGK